MPEARLQQMQVASLLQLVQEPDPWDQWLALEALVLEAQEVEWNLSSSLNSRRWKGTKF